MSKNLKLCCLLSRHPVARYALDNYDMRHSDWCTCGFGLCDTCAQAISKGSKPSRLWPKDNTSGHVGGYLSYVDEHYLYNRECPWTKAFVKQEGEPNLNG